MRCFVLLAALCATLVALPAQALRDLQVVTAGAINPPVVWAGRDSCFSLEMTDLGGDTWVLEGSNSGNTWYVIATLTGTPPMEQWRGAYQMLRLRLTAGAGATANAHMRLMVDC